MKKIITIFITLLIISIQCLAAEKEGNVSVLPERMQEVVHLLKYHDMNVYRRLQKVDSPLNENELLRLISDINTEGEPIRQRIVEELQSIGDNTHCPEAEIMKSNARRQKIIIQKGIHDERDRIEQISESSSYKQSELIVMSPDYKDGEMKHCDTRSNLKRITEELVKTFGEVTNILKGMDNRAAMDEKMPSLKATTDRGDALLMLAHLYCEDDPEVAEVEWGIMEKTLGKSLDDAAKAQREVERKPDFKGFELDRYLTERDQRPKDAWRNYPIHNR